MRTTGLGLSAVLIAAGAILAWAVTYEADGIDLQQVGVILFIVGLGLGLISLAMTAAGRRTTISAQSTVDPRHDIVVDGHPGVRYDRETIVEHDPRV